MNIVLKKARTGHGVEYFIACVKKNGTYRVLGKYMDSKGVVRDMSKSAAFETQQDAYARCRNLAKMKIRKKGFKEIALDEIPHAIAPHLEVPTDMQVTPEEMIQFLQDAKKERYVVFKDVTGIEDYFDKGVEYLAHTTDDEDYLTVFDRFGDPRGCFIERMESVSATEDAKKAEGFKKL